MNPPGPEQTKEHRNSGAGAGDEIQILNSLDNIPPKETPGLSFIQKVLISSGHVLNDLTASLWFTYALLYLKKVAEGGTGGSKGDSYAALALTIGQFVDGIATPIVGYEADHFTRCCLCDRNYGRFKSWHLVGSILVILSFPFIYSPSIGSTATTSNLTKFFYYTPFIIVFQIGWAAVQVSHLALIPKMHSDDLVRTDLFSKRYGFTVMANIIIFLTTWFTLGNNKDCAISEEDGIKFMMIGLIAIGIGFVFTLLFQILVKETPDTEPKSNDTSINAKKQLVRQLGSSGFYDPDQLSACSRRRKGSIIESIDSQFESQSKTIVQDQNSPQEDIPKKVANAATSGENSIILLDSSIILENQAQVSTANLNPSLKLGIKDWFLMPQFYMGAFVYMFTRLSVNLGQVYMPFYVKDFLSLKCSSVATVPLVMYISGFLVSMGVKFLNKLLGRQFAYTIGASLSILAACLIVLLDWKDSETNRKYIIYVVAVLLGGGSSAILVTSLSITADIIGSNIESGAFVYGIFSFTDKVSCGIAIMLFDHFLPCEQGDNKNAPSECLKSNGKYYQKILGYATGGSAMLGVCGVVILTILIQIRNRKIKADEGYARVPNCNQEDPFEEQGQGQPCQ